MVDGCRPIKGCIKKWIHGFANGQPELSTAKEANVKNMESFHKHIGVVSALIQQSTLITGLPRWAPDMRVFFRYCAVNSDKNLSAVFVRSASFFQTSA